MTTQTSDLLPEELVVAVLHKVGRDVRIVDDDTLATLFDEASQRTQLFAAFRSHPQYHYSRELTNALQVLDLGGSILRENAPTKYFRTSEHTAGPYGRGLLESLAPEEQREVERLAQLIQEAFSDAARRSGQ